MTVRIAAINAIGLAFGLDLVITNTSYILGLVRVDRVGGIDLLNSNAELRFLGITVQRR